MVIRRPKPCKDSELEKFHQKLANNIFSPLNVSYDNKGIKNTNSNIPFIIWRSKLWVLNYVQEAFLIRCNFLYYEEVQSIAGIVCFVQKRHSHRKRRLFFRTMLRDKSPEIYESSGLCIQRCEFESRSRQRIVRCSLKR